MPRRAAGPDPLEGWLAEALGAGDLVDVDGVLVDLRGLAGTSFACRPAVCTPGRRARGIVSCCADLELHLVAAERRGIERRLPQVRSVMESRDRRWAARVPALWEDTEARRQRVTRPGGRCVFAFVSPEGLRCGLHTAAEAHGIRLPRLKPANCRLFPLVLLRHGARTVLTASRGPVAAALGGPPESALACFEGPPLFEACRATLVELYGTGFYRRLATAARRWLRRTRASRRCSDAPRLRSALGFAGCDLAGREIAGASTRRSADPPACHS